MVEGSREMNRMAMRGAIVIAAVYGFFLIFAQFAFVGLLRAHGVNLMQEKLVLGTMAAAGMLGGIFAARRGASPQLISLALAVGAVAASLAPFAKMMPSALGIAIMTGAVLGVATVSLAALLPAWCSLPWIGLGTGVGYACCNCPAVFQATSSQQAWVAAAFALVGCIAVPSKTEWMPIEKNRLLPWWGVLALFTALVWLDSAAFFIIQHSTAMKQGTWGEGLLWRNAMIHLGFAVVAGVWLLRSSAKIIPFVAWGILAVAALAVNVAPLRPLAGWFYPAGVSLYSTALVAWPSWFSGAADKRQAAWRAAILFAVAGWFGSANGIGMAQTLQRVPYRFILISGAVVTAVWFTSNRASWRPAIGVLAILVISLGFSKEKKSRSQDAISRGRQVYLSEGCIHCHSQYVRPDSLDALNWGPVQPLSKVMQSQPVIIGNRRQGPDLTNIGARRSESWLKLHLINPQTFVANSQMPSYAHLFDHEKGDDLIRFLKDSSVAGIAQVMETASHWQPTISSKRDNGDALFVACCASCHGDTGQGNGPLAQYLSRKPANLVAGPFVWTPAGEALDLHISRILKFGIPGTDMAGHETLTDSQILALKDKVLRLRVNH